MRHMYTQFLFTCLLYQHYSSLDWIHHHNKVFEENWKRFLKGQTFFLLPINRVEALKELKTMTPVMEVTDLTSSLPD